MVTLDLDLISVMDADGASGLKQNGQVWPGYERNEGLTLPVMTR